MIAISFQDWGPWDGGLLCWGRRMQQSFQPATQTSWEVDKHPRRIGLFQQIHSFELFFSSTFESNKMKQDLLSKPLQNGSLGWLNIFEWDLWLIFFDLACLGAIWIIPSILVTLVSKRSLAQGSEGLKASKSQLPWVVEWLSCGRLGVVVYNDFGHWAVEWILRLLVTHFLNDRSFNYRLSWSYLRGLPLLRGRFDSNINPADNLLSTWGSQVFD